MGARQSSDLFVGRVAEMRVLETLASTIAGEGPAGAVIIGTPGLGKTRLLAEAARTVEWPFVQLHGYQTTHDVALGSASVLFRELTTVGKVGAQLEALLVGESAKSVASESVRLFEIAFRCLSRRGPFGLIADDAQWIDPQTLALLHYLVVAAANTGTPLFVACAGRPTPEVISFVTQFAEAFPTGRVARIDLGPLDDNDALDLLYGLEPGLTDNRAIELCRQASGSPFWIGALAADLESTGDTRHSLHALIHRRRANLDADSAALFTLLVVAARPLNVNGAGELLGWSDVRVGRAALDLSNRALVVQEGTVISIAHDLIGEIAALDLDDDERLRCHRRLAQWLEVSAGEDVSVMARALVHRVAAGLDGYNLALRIARSPVRRLVGAEVLATLGQIADSPSGTDHRDLQTAVATLALEVGDWSMALARWSVLADRAGTGPEGATAAVAAATAALKLGRSFDVHAFALDTRARACADPVLTIEADCVEAQSFLWLEGRAKEAQELVDRAMATSTMLVERVGGVGDLDDRQTGAYVRAVRANLDAAIRRADADTVHKCATAIQESARDPTEVLAAASDSIFSMLQLEGLPLSAEPRAKRALEESRRLALPSLEVEAAHWVGWITYHLGHLDEASALMHESVTLAERLGAPRRFTVPQLRAVLHAVEASRSDWRTNTRAIEDLFVSEPDPHFRIVIRAIHLGLVGRFSTAETSALPALIDAMDEDARVAACERCHWESVLERAAAFARVGSTEAAEDALKDWRLAHPRPRPGGPTIRHAYAKALLTARGDPEASVAMFARAAHDADEVGYRLLRLWIDLDAASTVAQIDRTQGVHLFEKAMLRAQELGARSESEFAMARLRGLGVHNWRRGPTVAAALSEREQQIAEAVASGATNLEIANAMFLSRKTVERHVSHILAKLGARNRAQLATMLVRKNEGVAR